MRKILTSVFAVLMLTLSASFASASPLSFTVNVDTSVLAGMVGETFWLDFLLIDGGAGSGANTVTIWGFGYGGGGSLPGTEVLTGGASGSLGSNVTLTDTDFVNDFYQQFVPGASLSFAVTTTAGFSGGTPDQFSFSILSGASPLNIATTDPLGTNTLLVLDIDGTVLSLGDVQTYASTDPSGVSVSAAPVPEPTSLLLLGSGLLGAVARRRMRRGA